MNKLCAFCVFLLLSISIQLSAWADDIPYLLTVASKGDAKSVKAILDTGANPNLRDIDGLTALMYATRKDKVEVVQLLLSKGADPN
ncbi:MAG: ankyrin repeat domain-containing protein, partial [Methylophilaceae bacterium]